MSWNQIILVRELTSDRVGTVARLVLYALASRSSDAGNSFPSVPQIMEDTGLSRPSVFRALKECRRAGLVEVVSGRGNRKSNNYRLLVHNFSQRYHTDTFDDSKGITEIPLRSHTDTLKVSDRDFKGITQIPEEEMKKKSKLVSIGAEAVHNSAPVHNSGVNGGDLAGSEDVDLAGIDGVELVERPWNMAGWVPCGNDRAQIVQAAFDYGLSSAEANAFWRWNATRRWTAVSSDSGVSVADLIRLWGEKWCRSEGADMLSWERARRRAVTIRK